MNRYLALLVFVLLSFAAAAFGSQFTPGEWYAALDKPPFNPPSWVFGPVWSLLYLMMAVAAWLVWLRRDTRPVTLALVVWLLQLVLNAIWSWLFFGLERLDLALYEMSALWLGILVCLVLFMRVRRAAGWLLVPYLAWVSFAWVLNFSLLRLNA